MHSERVYLHDTVQTALREDFIAWQCRIRQIAMRENAGRPSPGMQPEVTPLGAEQPLGRIIVLLHKAEPSESTAQLRHIVKKTHDPAVRRSDGLRYLQAAHFQGSRSFIDVMTALFGPQSAAVEQLIEAGEALLGFSQFSQSWQLPCRIERLARQHPLFQATYWHNSLFNPNLPGDVQVLAFHPDWSRALADPPPAALSAQR